MKDLVWRSLRGTIGSCGFSTIAYPDEEHAFAEAFFGMAFGRSKVRTVGDLVDAGRFVLPSSNPRSVIGNILMGDPSVSLKLPAPQAPGTLGATGGDGAVVLTWSAPPVQAAHFGLYRSEDGGVTWGLAGSPAGGERSFTDGGLVNGRTYAYYLTSWDADGFEGPPSPVATAVPTPGQCTVTCDAHAPALSDVGSPVPFTGSATGASCLGDLSYEWDFGDGSAHRHEPDVSHAYSEAGTYTWTFTAAADGVACTKSGTIAVVVPPNVTGVTKKPNPLRITITGTGFKAGLGVFVGSQQWSSLVLTPETQVKLKGPGLKAMFPKDTYVPIRLVNADGGETTVLYNRTLDQWHQGP
jgi:hypothetical protein